MAGKPWFAKAKTSPLMVPEKWPPFAQNRPRIKRYGQ